MNIFLFHPASEVKQLWENLCVPELDFSLFCGLYMEDGGSKAEVTREKHETVVKEHGN